MYIEKLKNIHFMVLPIVVGLILSMVIYGVQLVPLGEDTLVKFMNFYTPKVKTDLPTYSGALMRLTGALQLLAAALLALGLFKGEFLLHRQTPWLKWGILTAIFAVTLYGFAVRMISNHQAAAAFYFYSGLLYIFLWYIERHGQQGSALFEKLKTLPIFLIMLYTMGQPGMQKLFNSAQMVPYYVQMFEGSFLAGMPGGIPPFIYFLGFMEMLVPVLLVVSLVKGEFLGQGQKVFFSLACFVGISTFIMLSFGLTTLLNMPGAANLIYYAIFTLWFYYYTVVAKR